MKQLSLQELRESQMSILDYVDVFCRKHNIKYTISGGTLLGAVRHGGYIPWDDDMDIQMLRTEYVRFTELWNALKSEHPFELISIESGNNMGFPFGKIHDPRTVTYIGKLERTGVYIDVFPIDNVIDENDFVTRHAQVFALYKERGLIFEQMRYANERQSFKTWLRRLFVPRINKTYNQVAEEINSIAKRYEAETTNLRYEMIAGTRCKRPIPAEVFEQYEYIKFEDRKYMAVKDYDTYLTLTFGDYMTLPPVRERVSHGFIAYWR